LPTFKKGTLLSSTKRRTWRWVTPSVSASSSMLNSLGSSTGPVISVLLGLVFQPVGTKVAISCSPTNSHTSVPPFTSSRAATSLPLTTQTVGPHHSPKTPTQPHRTLQVHRSHTPAHTHQEHCSQNARPSAPTISSDRWLPLFTVTAQPQKSLFIGLSHPDKPQNEENTIASRWLARKLGRVC
jgi:hypothetical protein